MISAYEGKARAEDLPAELCLVHGMVKGRRRRLRRESAIVATPDIGDNLLLWQQRPITCLMAESYAKRIL